MRRTFGICFLVLLSAFCLWKYAERLTPMERLHSGNFSLEQLQREKCVIITDLCEIKKAELWEDFIKKVKHASDAKVRVLFVYSGEKEGSTLACGVEIPGQLILFHAHIPGQGISPKWFSIT